MSKSSRTWLGATGLAVVAASAVLIAAGGGSTAKPNAVARKTAAASIPDLQWTSSSSAPKLGTSVDPLKDTCNQPGGTGELVVRKVDPRTGAPGEIVYDDTFSIAQPEPDSQKFDVNGLGGLPKGTPLIIEVPYHCPGYGYISSTGVVLADGTGGISRRDQPGAPHDVTSAIPEARGSARTPSPGHRRATWAPARAVPHAGTASASITGQNVGLAGGCALTSSRTRHRPPSTRRTAAASSTWCSCRCRAPAARARVGSPTW